jgi:hypothetical protein
MSAVTLLASTVMDGAAALMNDPSRTVYTYTAQLPYLRLALQGVQQYYELHSIPVTEDVSAVIEVDAGQTEIVYDGVGVPTLPSDMVEPLQLWERSRGIDPFIPMTRKQFLPHYLEGTETNQFIIWVWQDQAIKLLAANADNDIKIDYNRELFPDVNAVDQNTQLNIINAGLALSFKTAALCAKFIERNAESAIALASEGELALQTATGIDIKGKQNIMTRRRPFRQSYKRRGWL